MIGVILAAGKGSRLKNYTTDSPKSLLPLNEQGTLLDYNIDILRRLAVDKIYIVTGFRSELIEQKVAGDADIQCIYNPFWDKCNVLGSLYMALQKINDSFLFLHADTLVDISAWQTLYHFQGDIVMPYKIKECGEEEMKVILGDHGTLLEVNKTMDPAVANGEFLGIAKFSKEVIPFMINAAELLFKKGDLNHYMEAAVELAIKDKVDVKAFDILDARFVEVDFEEDYLLARTLFA